MTSAHYRAFEHDDLEAVAAVWMESRRSIGRDVAELPTLRENQDRIRREIENGWHVIVASENVQIVGFLACKSAEGLLDQLFISPNAKGRGIGTALLKRAMTEMPAGFWLRAAVANRAARGFYESHGLRPTRIEPHPTLGHMTVIYVWP
jgi:ribosomal protein S18 acetylase RimI-like enzyme